LDKLVLWLLSPTVDMRLVFLRAVCLPLSVCLFSHDMSKIAAARITKFDVEMFYHESW